MTTETTTANANVNANVEATIVSNGYEIKDPGQVHAEAMQLFPNNPQLRMIHYGRYATYRNLALGRNPRMCVFDFIGTHGEGKTAIMADYVLKVCGLSHQNNTAEEIDACLAEHLSVIRGGGITDFADITGLQYIDPKDKQTKLARQEAFGGAGQSTWRLVVIDDWTRALPHVLQGLMHIMNEGRFNAFSLDKGAFIVATRNPEGDEYNVSGVDPAQYSRTIPIAYNVDEKTFFEQCQAQKIDPDMLNFWMRHPELCRPRKVKVDAVKDANCSRFRMLWNSVYDFIKYDQIVLNEVATTMFGPNFLTTFLADRRAQQPIQPLEILDNFNPKTEKTVQEYIKSHQDVLTVTAQRMAYYLNDKDTTTTDAQLLNLIKFMAILPDDTAFMLSKLLVDEGQPKRDLYSVKISSLGKQLPNGSNVAKKIVDLRNNINKKLAGM